MLISYVLTMHVCLCPLVSVMTLGLCCHRVDAWEETTMNKGSAWHMLQAGNMSCLPRKKRQGIMLSLCYFASFCAFHSLVISLSQETALVLLSLHQVIILLQVITESSYIV
jgi:hypothetical protein